jgi:hypothetical protein
MEAIRNEKHEIIGYRQEDSDGRVQVRTEEGELVRRTASGQSRKADGTIVSFQDNEAPVYLRSRYSIDRRSGEKMSPDM